MRDVCCGMWWCRHWQVRLEQYLRNLQDNTDFGYTRAPFTPTTPLQPALSPYIFLLAAVVSATRPSSLHFLVLSYVAYTQLYQIKALIPHT